MTFRAFGGPHLYVQGPGALSQLADRVAALGGPAFVVADAVVADLLGDRLRAALGPDATFATFGGNARPARSTALRPPPGRRGRR
ncbi:hypothetical protein [Xanthobacter dioxanivorans]|uniref:hypothetical protein n=1 Tax=Xanthobacter dioxanivorans TaxID=2528964 RepID=UPI001E2E7E88|nr:hypothetical protein [Xanthobacter dioxanivorans]